MFNGTRYRFTRTRDKAGLTVTIYWSYTDYVQTFENCTQREANGIITNISHLQEKHGEVGVKIEVTSPCQ